MAQAMATVGNGGTLYQTQIARQVQTLNNEIVYTYNPRVKDLLKLSTVTKEEIKQGMIGVVSSANGTAGSADIRGVKVAGKTGTAQWGPKNKERTAAWFAGFAPADNPKYAFAALYEAAPGDHAHGGTAAAPMIGDMLKELFKSDSAGKKSDQQDDDEDSSGLDQSN
jgi:penicillin-binding protein 2